MYNDFRQFFTDIRDNWGLIADRFQYARNKFFYHEDFVKLLLFGRSYADLPKTSFVDYNLVFDYYNKNRRLVQLVRGDETKSLELPYEELINFIDHPDATISIDGEIGTYQMPEEIRANTQNAFDAFMQERPNTTDEPKLDIVDFQKHSDTTYSVTLEKSTYFDAVRTNFSLDYPMDNDFFETMRLLDLSPDNQLRPLSESKMANHIGVCSVLAFKRGGYWYFHMMPRSGSLGVYNNMLSSVGGGVEPPTQPITNLVDYVTDEVIREIQEEMGLDLNSLEQARRAQVIPLAFTRELTRGGLPQFFFLTVLEEVSDEELKETFKNATSRDEFRTDLFANITSLDDVVSPEFSTNLFYALEYIQKQQKLPTEVLDLT